MEPDYPAAHSMDTWWFAVDQLGHVAVFFSAEDGPIPLEGDSDHNPFEVLARLDGDDPASADLDDIDFQDVLDELADRGLFVYEYIGEFNTLTLPYTKTYEIDTPLHVDQLPPELRTLFVGVRLPETLFTRDERVQPVGQVECLFWTDNEDVGYVCADDKTVLPVPGKEDKFPEFRDDFLASYPDRAKDLHFERPQPPPPDQETSDGT